MENFGNFKMMKELLPFKNNGRKVFRNVCLRMWTKSNVETFSAVKRKLKEAKALGSLEEAFAVESVTLETLAHLVFAMLDATFCVEVTSGAKSAYYGDHSAIEGLDFSELKNALNQYAETESPNSIYELTNSVLKLANVIKNNV